MPAPKAFEFPLEPIERNRASATTRALQLIKQYELWQFDASNPHKYLEWKYLIQDVCDLCENDPFVKLELLLNSLKCDTSADLRLTLSDQYSLYAGQPLKLFTITFEYMDRIYCNLRSRRYVEHLFLGISMTPNQSITEFASKFQRSCRLFERARSIKLSESDKVLYFGKAIHSKYRPVMTLVETTCGSDVTFSDYLQKVIYLYQAMTPDTTLTPTDTDFSLMETRNAKRQRDNDENQFKRKQGFGCYRCLLGNHRAIDCTNKLADPSKRCSKCGSRKHVVSDCKAILKRNCLRCRGEHYESACPIDKPKGETNAAPIDGFRDLQQALDATMQTIDCEHECGSVSTDIVDDFAPTLSVKFSVDTEPRSGLIDTGAAASFINTSMIFDLIKSGSIKREDIIKLEPPIRIRFGNCSTFSSDMALRAKIRVSDQRDCFDSTFVICPSLNPSLIIGRPLLRVLQFLPAKSIPVGLKANETTSEQSRGKSTSSIASFSHICVNNEPENTDSMWITTVSSADKMKLQIRFPLMENLLMVLCINTTLLEVRE